LNADDKGCAIAKQGYIRHTAAECGGLELFEVQGLHGVAFNCWMLEFQ